MESRRVRAVVATVVIAAAGGYACAAGSPSAGLSPAGEGTAAPASALCASGKPVDYPPGPYKVALLATLPPDLVFDGTNGPVRVRDWFEPCAARSRLVVVRTSAAWCGSCRWHAAHTQRLLGDPRFTGRLILLDLLVADEDNMPAVTAAAERWRAVIDAPGTVAIDTKYTFAPVLVSKSPLPEYVVVDTRTMTVRTVASDPDPEGLARRLGLELADLDGSPHDGWPEPELHDGLFTENQWDLIRGMKLDAVPPADPTNEVGDLPAAAALGKQLYFDKLLSPSGTVACSTCHSPDAQLGDVAPQSTGVSRGTRNSPTVGLAAHARWQFWDGRADTVWMQALGPFENPAEFGSSRLYVAHQVASRYASSYQAVFGAKYPLPDMSDVARFPASGKPGDPAWEAMAPADRDAVTRVYVNVGKAIAAFERAIRVSPNALDRYADGDVSALTDAQKQGLAAFLRVGCAQCHWGPRMTDDAFHALRFPTGRADGQADRGRIDVMAGLAKAEFVATSKWSDAPSAAKSLVFTESPTMLGAFKTPTLRGLPRSAPYGHGGTLATLADITRHYGGRGLPPDDARAVGDTEAWAPDFDMHAQEQIVEVLQTLTADLVMP